MAVRVVSDAREPEADDVKRPSFVLSASGRSYEQQYASMYYLRLAELRPRLVPRAKAKWSRLADGRSARHCTKLLDVEKGKLCFVVGTVYVDMPLKPNVLEDLAREHYVSAPPPRRKFCSSSDEVMLEDESGRVRLVGDVVQSRVGQFVTGTIMAALGAELPTGDFEVLDVCFSGIPPHPIVTTKARTNGHQQDRWIAIVSGLEMGADYVASDIRTQMLVEWILGELESDDEDAVHVSRLILAGNSLGEPEDDLDEDSSKPKRYGYEATYSNKPTKALDTVLAELLPSIDIDIMPGETDPTGPTMPQQPLHRAMFPNASAYPAFKGRTNPCWLDVDGISWVGPCCAEYKALTAKDRLLGTSGQPLDDIFKYLSSEDRLDMTRKTLEWSHIAPTCPDTLWSYPYSKEDPFLLHRCPNVYFIGNQPAFETSLVEQERSDEEGDEQVRCRIVLVPEFCESGTLVLVNTSTLDVKTVQFTV